MSDPTSEYKLRFDRYSKESFIVGQRIKTFSNLRLFLFVAVCAGAVFIYRSQSYLLLTIELIAGFSIFTGAVIWHNELYRKRDILKKYLKINEMGLMRLKGEWGEFNDYGADFVDHEHPYTWDLDIFGKNSMYQWLCVSHSFSGRRSLAQTLREPQKNVELITGKQEAVRELADLLDWRQKFELYGVLSETGGDPDSFLKWSENEVLAFKWNITRTFFRSLPYISLIIGVAGLIITQTLLFFAAMYAVQLAIFGLFYSKTASVIRSYEKNGSLLAYSQLIETIEKQKFSAPCINALKGGLGTDSKKSAAQVLHAISKILNATEIRSNPLGHLIVNAVWLWDIQCVIKADALKKRYGSDFRRWIETIGTFEMLSSLSIASFENPEWVFPSFNESGMGFVAAKLGHPLLHKSARVDNDFTIEQGGSVAIVTGSNMSGKSTFLRSMGVNAILAYSGAPVCASSFVCPIVNIYSSMRINDDLSSKVSTFYAELLRIKKIVEAVKKNEAILFLLDELFRGTNSQDSHDGAVAVLHALSNKKSVGIVSTHDMDLCKLAEKDPIRFVNFHFEEYYRDDTVAFDYKLKKGQSTTKNAMFLIKMIGVEAVKSAE
jgi:hypothetical protein